MKKTEEQKRINRVNMRSIRCKEKLIRTYDTDKLRQLKKRYSKNIWILWTLF